MLLSKILIFSLGLVFAEISIACERSYTLARYHEYISQNSVEVVENDRLFYSKELYDKVKRRHKFLYKNRNGAAIFHGSSSSSLAAFFKRKNGLEINNNLIQSDKPPFSGEFLQGAASTGVNAQGISITTFDTVDYSLLYSVKGGWDISKAHERVKRLRIQIAENKKNALDYLLSVGKDDLSQLDDITDPRKVIRNGISIAETNLQLELARIKAWPDLTQLEKELIQNPFPVLYGFKPKDSRVILANYENEKYFDEYISLGGLSTEELVVVFVPADKVAYTQKLLQHLNEVQVHPIEPVLGQSVHLGKLLQEAGL